MLPIGDVNPTRRTAVVTVLLIIACVGVFAGFQLRPGTRTITTEVGAVEFPASDAFVLEWAAVPCEVVTSEPLSVREVVDTYGRGDANACSDVEPDGGRFFAGKQVYLAVLVSMFLHGGWLHLGGNMLFLWIFGNNIEDRLGHVRYVLFYVAGGFFATFAHVAVQPFSTVPVVGASGAIAAVMGAYLVWFPNAPVRALVLVFIPIVVRAKWFLGIWFVTQFFTNPASGVAWVAHVAGFVFGVVFALFVRRGTVAQERVFRPEYRAGGGWDDTGGWRPPPPPPGSFGGR